MILLKNFWQRQCGMVSLSALLILSVIVMISVSLYGILQYDIGSLNNFKMRMEAQNFTLDSANFMIKQYADDYTLWKNDIAKVGNTTDFRNAKVVKEITTNGKFGKQTATLYLMLYHDNIYILVIEVRLQEVVNQMRVYLQDEFINNEEKISVYRWEL